MDGFFAVALIDLTTTLFAYLLIPIILVKSDTKMKLKTIRIIAIINGLVIWILFRIITPIFAEATTDIDISVSNGVKSALLWSFVGYGIMKKRCLKSDVKKADISSTNECTPELPKNSLSKEEQESTSVGNYNVYGNDIKIHHIEGNTSYSTQKQENTKPLEKSKKGKKKIKKTTIAIATLFILIVISIVINIIQLDKYNKLIDKYSTLAVDYNDINEFYEAATAKRDAYKELLEEEREDNETNSEKAEFLDENIVFVLDGYGNYYYTYDQVKQVTQGVDEYYYWVYHIEDAIYRGYTAWD